MEEENIRERGYGERERMCLIIQHYPCSLFMALLEEPVETLYTYCRLHRLLP